jgi:magnesium and cobalt transporter
MLKELTMPNPDSGPSHRSLTTFISWLKKKWKNLKRAESDTNLREALEELIEESEHDESVIESDERVLLGNVLNLRDSTAQDVMVPRVDIIAVSVETSAEDLMTTFLRSRLSRMPVYRNNLDDVIGMVQIKDVLSWSTSGKPLNIRTLVKEVLFVSPSMRTLDLLFQMRESGTKMALVVDEHGGVDGLVSFSDLIEEIIGDIQDAQERGHQEQLITRPDGTIIADARITLEELDDRLKINLVIPELEDEVDTIGGLVGTLVGRVPTRGELIPHPSGYEIEVLDADPRRVKRLCIRKKV